MIEKEKPNEKSNIKKVIAIMSGKGGVGKSTVTSLIGTALKEEGYRVGIMDADITGPSIPKLFGINKRRAEVDKDGISPVSTSTGIKVMSLNLLIDREDSPVIWRGPMISNTVRQFFTEVTWGHLDYLLIDLPPGTGDVSLTVMQSLPLDGIIVVSSPQDLVKLIVKKSLNMAKIMDTPVLGIVENMSCFQCSECGKRINIFGKSRVEEIAKEMGIGIIANIPIDPDFTELCDEGRIELYGKINYSMLNDLSSSLMKVIGGAK